MTQSELKALLHYDPETGVFAWLPRPRIRGGKVAGNVSPDGYWRIGLGGRPSKLFLAHRLAWLYMTGEWPRLDIDHINGDKTDNRWSNLRDVTRSVNLQNQRRARSDSTSGLLGAHKNGRGWSARIYVDGVKRHLGTFATAAEAHAHYLEAKRRVHEGCTI